MQSYRRLRQGPDPVNHPVPALGSERRPRSGMQCNMPCSRLPWILAGCALGGLLPASAQDAPPKRLGVFLWHDSPNDLATLAGIRAGLDEARLRCTFVEHRADSDPEQAKVALRALLDARCDLVFALGTQAALLAKDAILDVPVVFAAVSDAVASGVVPDWSGSGINLCGASNWIPPARVLDVFRLAVPGCRRLGVLRSKASGVVSTAELQRMREWLATPGAPSITLHEAIATDAAHIGEAVATLLAQDVDALWIPIDITIYQNVAAVQQAIGTRPLPLVTTAAAAVRSGAHVGAAVDYGLHGRRAAALAVEVLVHRKHPGALPIDRMHGVSVAVHLAAARRAGVELPLSLLALTDELIDAPIGTEAARGNGK